MMQIDMQELAQITARLFEHVQAVHGQHVSLDQDYYWWIQKTDCYNPLEQPKHITLGRLSDNLSELKETLNGDREPVVYSLVWLATIIRYVGESVDG